MVWLLMKTRTARCFVVQGWQALDMLLGGEGTAMGAGRTEIDARRTNIEKILVFLCP
jgi:hypothetical protein